MNNSSEQNDIRILRLRKNEHIPIIVPVGMPASTLLDPSRGSKTAQYLIPASIKTSFVDSAPGTDT